MYKIIIDSCGELTEELKADGHYESVPLEMEVNGHRIVDDATFDQQDFLKKVKESPVGPKSSCPSPERYMEAFKGEAEHIYVVTLSKELSGSYNSAVLAKNLYEEEYGKEKKQIYVFNSRSASIGETLIGIRVQECEEAGMEFDKIVEVVEAYIGTQHTYFVLETLETLRKNGRLSNLKAFVANALNIKPVMGSTPEGSICQLAQARGMNKALKKMVEEAISKVDDSGERILAISHCNCPMRAESVKEEIERITKFKKIIIADTAGISSMYANDGGVIIAV
ncbi:DegV family protein [Roseburia sp. BX1005]|uniref:DegV family protein n=1 Tax=Roseburia zhanii TaxID=2763064 RepID=A0A923RTQ7_9FIRM|nr:DegV family protein [Roseburia zhanii]MBC5714115.1 DegV family protein [Roseburia zhanii]